MQGWREVPLNDRGREQAQELAAAAAGEGIAALWSSHAWRASETAAIVGEALGLEPRLDERLRESHRGVLGGAPARGDRTG